MASSGNTNLVQFDPGILNKNAWVIIVKTEWNASIVDELEKGCLNILDTHGMTNRQTLIVPGAVEIPFAVKACWEARKYQDHRPCVFITLGCVIKGDTPHFDYVCKAVTEGVVQLNLSLPVPVIFGVLTVNSLEQALERVGGAQGHKGEEAAVSALKMINLLQQLK